MSSENMDFNEDEIQGLTMRKYTKIEDIENYCFKTNEPGEEKEEKHFTRIIPRDEWGALPSRELPPINPPISKIYFSFHRNYPQCFDLEECSETVRKMQLREMNEQGLPDVRHNFMISNDCNVFEGRGWHGKPESAYEDPDTWDHKAMDIGFFAENPNESWPFKEMFEVAFEFIEYGIKHNLITKDFVYI